MSDPTDFNLSCPIPIQQYPHVLMAHGGGGKLMHQLISQMFLPTFDVPTSLQHDAAVLELTPSNRSPKLAFTTDSYVVKPLFFPGGDIGALAVYGTVNDLAMAGARPLYLSASFILEEGLPMSTLWQIIQSMRSAAQIANVQIVTGDTKVVDKGKGDGIFINTAGVGIVECDRIISSQSVRSGDAILLSGDIGRHGIAIMAVREGLGFETTIQSDAAPLADLVLELLAAEIEIHMLRDLTRGGLASALNEIALAAGMSIEIDENLIPVREDVQGACEILGFDPIYIANEGRFIAFVPQTQAEKALEIMRSHNASDDSNSCACQIGRATDNNTMKGLVTMVSRIGVTRIIDMLSGEQLPRIC
ncbi:hydrogenase expression/formation protein HypE [Pseudanabaena sp. PCC 6802]|uniref:hydrogenase expression/formation protein HypE n=1 Tax=Pseudanabaena sp. PCC 6802 TaxID=118173 RepID=UPI0003497B4C|nr:hydrogenase expression/formation protein HypE [Pseudanabaena sp. PCC 6802]